MDELEGIHDIKTVKNFLCHLKNYTKQNSFLFGYESLMFLAQRNYWHPPLFLPYYSQILTLVSYSQICKLPHLLAFLALNSLLCTMLNSQVNSSPKRSMVATQFHVPVNVQYFLILSNEVWLKSKLLIYLRLSGIWTSLNIQILK